MRPLIPRVRVGDVLLGTRNLRYYLQTASTLNYLNEISREMAERNRAKSTLYRPSKEDEFLVTVNAWGTFGVYNASKDLILLFRNPSADNPGPFPLPSGAKMSAKKRSAKYGHSTRMDPTIFSKWFIRTPKKYVDLTTWPPVPYFMWAALHLNIRNIGSDSAPTFHCDYSSAAPFNMSHQLGRWNRDQLEKLIREWSVRGITRPNATQGLCFPSAGFGPCLDEIKGIRREIQNLCSNPRLAQRLKAEDNYVYKAFLQNNP